MKSPCEEFLVDQESWNAFRAANPNEKVKLSKIDFHRKALSGYNFRGVELADCNFRGASLENCDFTGGNLSGSNLSDATIEGCDFFEAELACANLSCARIRNSSFLRSDLMGTLLREAHLEFVDLRFTRMEDTDLTNAFLKKCKIYGASIWSCRCGIDRRSEVIITPEYEAEIVTKDLEIAQYIYLMNKKGLVNFHSVSLYDPVLRSKEKAFEFHVFISHASEDKDAVARPLAQSLESVGLRVWYDETSLAAGDSLREKIDHGLSRSLFGLVILSQRFFQKRWAVSELNAMFSLDHSKRKYLIPVWHEISREEILEISPLLADRLAIVHQGDPMKICMEVLKIIHQTTSMRPDR